MRIAILGNSHTASLVHAANEDPAIWRPHEAIYFAAIGKTMAGFAVEQGRLIPGNEPLRRSIAITSGGQESFDPNAFDAVFMIGLGYNVSLVDSRVSRAVRAAIVRHAVHVSTAWKLAGMIRQVSDVPLFVGHSPQRGGDMNENFENRLDNSLGYGEITDMSQQCWNAIGAEVIRQPTHTLFRGFLTRRSYSRGSRGLRGEGLFHDDTDRSHMNAEYGVDYIAHMKRLLIQIEHENDVSAEKA